MLGRDTGEDIEASGALEGRDWGGPGGFMEEPISQLHLHLSEHMNLPLGF